MKNYRWFFDKKDFSKFAEVVGHRAGVDLGECDKQPAIIGMATNQDRMLVLTRWQLIAIGIKTSKGFASQLVNEFGMPDSIDDCDCDINPMRPMINNWAWEQYDEDDERIPEQMFNPDRDIPRMREFLGLPPEVEEVEEPEAEPEVEEEKRPLKRPTRPRQGGTPRIPRNQRGCENGK